MNIQKLAYGICLVGIVGSGVFGERIVLYRHCDCPSDLDFVVNEYADVSLDSACIEYSVMLSGSTLAEPFCSKELFVDLDVVSWSIYSDKFVYSTPLSIGNIKILLPDS